MLEHIDEVGVLLPASSRLLVALKFVIRVLSVGVEQVWRAQQLLVRFLSKRRAESRVGVAELRVDLIYRLND